jgi:hypothetical protein
MSTNTKMQENKNGVASSVERRGKTLSALDIVIIVAMGILMFCGASWQIFRPNTDVAKYQCYAAVFLHGTHVATSYPNQQCSFISESQTYTNAKIAVDLQKYRAPSFLVNFVKHQNVTQPLRALPHEYPLLTLIPFLLVLFAPQPLYQIAFAILMALLAGVMYFLLARFKSRTAAIIGATLLVIGGWSTAVGRFDLVPSLLTLVAVILAERKRWTWAFVLLALAFLLKFYPVMLLIPFLIGQQMESHEKWNAWRRWQPFAAFIGVCVLVMGVSLLLSVEGTVSPLSYFETRPIQAESLGSSLLWLSTFVTHHALAFDNTYHSLNVQPVHILTTLVTYGEQLLELAGLAFIAWLLWRRRINLATATLLTLLVVIVTGKVFSPQYLIWVIPLVAYVVGTNWRWIASWIVICALTTSIYPYTYYAPGHTSIIQVPLVPWFYPAVTLRNFILLGFVLALFIYYYRHLVLPATTTEQPNTGEILAVSAQEQAIPISIVDTDVEDKSAPPANIGKENSSNVELNHDSETSSIS